MFCIIVKDIYNQTPLPRDKRTILLVRGMAGGLSIAAQYYGMKHMPIGDDIFSITIQCTVVCLVSSWEIYAIFLLQPTRTWSLQPLRYGPRSWHVSSSRDRVNIVCMFCPKSFQEPLGILDVLNVLLTILGLVFIIRPPFIYGYDRGQFNFKDVAFNFSLQTSWLTTSTT